MGDSTKEIVKKFAKKLNLSIRDVERKAGLGNGTIGNWDERSPKVDTLKKVANVLNVPVAFLVDEREDKET